MLHSFKEFIIEGVKLTPLELDKPNSKTGESRLEILKREISNSKPLELAKGGKIIITNIDEVLNDLEEFKNLKRPITLVDKSGSIYSTSDLLKSEVFGGGAGAGGGTKQTAIAESAQCVWIEAMLSLGPSASLEEFTDSVLSSAYKNVDVDSELKDILEISNDWIVSSYLTAQYLVKNSFVNKNMKLHRGSKTMKQIYEKKNIAVKNSGLSKFTDDKWNPGDIWAVDKSFSVSSLPEDSLRSLNKSLLENFNNRKLVGISLKKVSKNPKHRIINQKVPPDTEDHKIKELKSETNRGSFWSAKSCTVIIDNGTKIDLRPNAFRSPIKAEILGKGARGGSASWNYIADAIKNVLKVNIPSFSVILQKSRKIQRNDLKEIKEFYEKYVSLAPNPESLEEFIKNLSSKDDGWISAKLGGVYILYVLHKHFGEKANRTITKIVNYAGSASEDASVYVKVSN